MEIAQDRRSVKTRTALLDAFRYLLLARGYEGLQVSDVSEKANVGRSTFYEHFRSKAELLRASLETPLGHMADMVLAEAGPAEIIPWLQHFREHQQVTRVLLGWPTRPILSQVLTSLVAARLRRPADGPAFGRQEVAARLIADAQLALLDIWMFGRPASTVEAIADALKRSSSALAEAFVTDDKAKPSRAACSE